jgi:hypothetical protein
MTAYALLLKDFIQQLGAGDADVPATAGLEFEHDDLLVKISPHSNNVELLLEVAILKLDEDTPLEVNYQRFHTLLQLNALARQSHGAAAAVTDDNILTLGRTLQIAALDVHTLVNHFNRLIELALELRHCWQNLGSLLQRQGDPSNAASETPYSGNYA